MNWCLEGGDSILEVIESLRDRQWKTEGRVGLQWVLYRFASLVNSIESYFVCRLHVVLIRKVIYL